jgi:hypothetical protein
MTDFAGRWVGSIRGTNSATFILALEQTEESIRGGLSLNDVALGPATFDVEGTAGDAVARFRLIPRMAAPGAGLTEGTARASASSTDRYVRMLGFEFWFIYRIK